MEYVSFLPRLQQIAMSSQFCHINLFLLINYIQVIKSTNIELIINQVMWHSSEDSFARNAHNAIYYINWEIH